MPAVKFLACLGVCAYLILNKNPHFSRHPLYKIYISSILYIQVSATIL